MSVLWKNEANADERRFLKDIDAIIEIAEDGDLHQTFNIISYFCKKVTVGEVSDIRITRFVSNVLISAQPKAKVKRWRRNLEASVEIHKEHVTGRPLKPCSKDVDSAAKRVSDRLISRGYPIGEHHVVSVKYEELPLLLVFHNSVKMGYEPRISFLRIILPDAKDFYRRLFNQQNGKTVRSRLNLQGFKYRTLSNSIDDELIEEVSSLISEGNSMTRSCKIAAKNYNNGLDYESWIKWEKVKQTYYRHRQVQKIQQPL